MKGLDENWRDCNRIMPDRERLSANEEIRYAYEVREKAWRTFADAGVVMVADTAGMRRV